MIPLRQDGHHALSHVFQGLERILPRIHHAERLLISLLLLLYACNDLKIDDAFDEVLAVGSLT